MISVIFWGSQWAQVLVIFIVFVQIGRKSGFGVPKVVILGAIWSPFGCLFGGLWSNLRKKEKFVNNKEQNE